MKRSTIVWIIIGVCLLVFGGVIFCLSMGLAKWDFSVIGNEKYKTREVELSGSFRDIIIEGKVVFYETEDRPHTAEVKDDTLFVKAEDKRSFISRIGLFSYQFPKTALYLPEKDYSSLNITTGTGDIEIPAGFRFDSITATSDTGNVGCFADASGSILVALSTGNITLSGLDAGDLILSVSTGHITVSSVKCSGKVSIAVSTGRSELTDVTCESFTSTGDTGDLTLHNLTAVKSLSIERDTGDVTFDRCDAVEITVKTETGDVMGTIRSDKVFIVETDTGDIDVPKTATGGKCEITTDTGDISIKIEQ